MDFRLLTACALSAAVGSSLAVAVVRNTEDTKADKCMQMATLVSLVVPNSSKYDLYDKCMESKYTIVKWSTASDTA